VGTALAVGAQSLSFYDLFYALNGVADVDAASTIGILTGFDNPDVLLFLLLNLYLRIVFTVFLFVFQLFSFGVIIIEKTIPLLISLSLNMESHWDEIKWVYI
jgi:hypothetical protein